MEGEAGEEAIGVDGHEVQMLLVITGGGRGWMVGFGGGGCSGGRY